MFNRKLIIICAVLYLVIYTAMAHAQPPQIQSGLSYLISFQNPDGTWGSDSSINETTAVTVAGIEALKVLNQTVGSSYTNATVWLQAQTPIPVDYIAERIHALALTDSSVNALFPAIDQKKHIWGGDEEYVVNLLDTASALQALKTANYPDQSYTFQAIPYLLTIQNTDGGWGFSPSPGSGQAGDDSSVFVTAQVLSALAQFKNTYLMPQQINNASAFLLSKQNPDGGFGAGSSTIYETALAFIALMDSGQGQLLPLQNALNYLTTTQAANGSWNDDPYSTALALRALSYVKPDLTILPANIAVLPFSPTVGDNFTVTATVANIGLEAAANITVRLLDNGASAGERTIAAIAPGGTGQAVFVISPLAPSGEHILTVVVDPGNIIVETSKANNSSTLRIWAKIPADLIVQPEYLSFSPATPKPGDIITLTANIANMGESAAGSFSADLYDGDPASGGTRIGSFPVGGIEAGSWGSGTLSFSLTAAGSHTLYLVADPQNSISEQNKANNTAAKTITISATGGLTDLAITNGGLTITPARPKNGDSTTITVMASNLGTVAATASLELFDGLPTSGGALLHQESVTLNPGEFRTVTVPWTATPGIHTLYGVIDRAGLVPETDKSNNSRTLAVMTDMVDIEVSAADISIEPEHPMAGDPAAVKVIVHNLGIAPTGPFNVNLYNGDPVNGGTLLQSFAVTNLDGDTNQVISYPFTAVRGTYRFYAVCDPENRVMELHEDNNLAIRSLLVKSSAEAKGPDLVPLEFDLSGAVTDPQSLRISGTAKVKFQNKGDDKVTTPFRITVFEDRDGDGIYTEGIDLSLGSWDYSIHMNPNMAAIVTINLSGTLTFRDAPIYAMLDSGQVVFEQNKGNNTIRKGSACEARPAKPIEPVVKWKMNTATDPTFGRITSTPVVISLTDTNGDGRIDNKDTPAILVNTYAGNYQTSEGKIWALDGKTGTPVMTRYESGEAPYEGGSLLVGDIEGTGIPEIVVTKRSNGNISRFGGFLAFANDGTLKWDNTSQVAAWASSHPFMPSTLGEYEQPALADLDGDGQTEIISSEIIVKSDGSIRCTPDARQHGGLGSRGSLGYVVSVADLDMDGKQEIIAGNTAYNSDCSVKWLNTSVPDGYNAIGNFHDDPYPEIVVLADGKLYLLAHDGNIIWGPVYIPIYSGLPIIADFDGDGKPEIGIHTYGQYLIYDGDGRLKLTLSLPTAPGFPSSDWNNAPTVFDLNGDGIPEVLINSSGYFSIFNGKDGSLLYQEYTGDFGTAGQNVIVADVNGDGHAEAVVIGNYAINPMSGSLRVYGAKNNDWVATRSIWNEPSYHVTNVNDDGSIPQYEAPSWLLNNNYRCNAPTTTGPNPYLASDLSASFARMDMADFPRSVSITARVGNGGAIQAAAGIRTAFYDGDPAAGGVLIGSALTTKILNPGDYEDVTLVWSAPGEGNHTILVNTDADNTLPECDKTNNSVSLPVYITAGKPDLSIAAEDMAVPAGIPEGVLTTIPVTVRNIGTQQAQNVLVRLFSGNPATGGKQIGADQIFPAIAAGGMTTAAFTWNTLGAQGTTWLYAVVDPGNAIAESNKNNNTAIKQVTVTPADKPDLQVAAEDIAITPAAPTEGDPLTVAVDIHNRGLATGNVKVALYNGNPASGGKPMGTASVSQLIPLGGSAWATFTLDSVGLSGANTLFVKVDPDNLIDESDKTNNQASRVVTISPAGLNLGIRTDKTAYSANENVQVIIALAELNDQARTLAYDLRILDKNGVVTAMALTDVALPLAPNAAITFTAVWNAGATIADNYTALVSIKQGGRVIAKATAPITILPVKTVAVAISADKIAYAANEIVALVATITSASPNYQFTNLTGLFTLADSNGKTVFSETRTITTLLPGGRAVLKSSWNTAANAKGAYTATLELFDGTVSLSSTPTSFGVTGSASTGAGLTGTLAVQPGIVEAGAGASFSFGITNRGNEDLSSLALSILLVDPDSGQILATLPLPSGGPLAVNGTQTGSLPLATSGLTPKTLLAILQNNCQGVIKSIASTPLTIKDTTPPVLTVSTLSDGSNTNNATLNIAGIVTDNSGVQGVTINGTAVPVNADGSFSYALILNSGANTIATIATDLAGNQSTDTRTITLDQTAPALVVVTPADNSKTGAAPLTVTGNVDEASGVTVKIGNNTVNAAVTGNTFSADLTLLSGNNTIEVTATDLAGNQSSQKRTVLYDDRKPAAAITAPNQDIRINKGSFTIKGTASDPMTAVTVTITMDDQTYTPAVTNGTFEQAVSFTTEKSHVIVVTAMNEVGTSASAQRNIIYDITPPTLTIDPLTSPTNQAAQVVTGTMEAGATVTVTSATAIVGAIIYPTATTWSAPASGFSTDVNDIAVSATDAAGNVTSATARVLYDTTPPTGTIAINNGAAVTNATQVQLALSASDANVVGQMRFSSDGANWTAAETYATTRVWSLTSSDEVKQVYVQYQDNAGNWSTNPITAAITLDTTPPAVSAAPPGGIFKTVQNVALTASEFATIYYTTDGTTPTTSSHIYSQAIAIAANTTLKYLARDLAGNVGAVNTENYIIDTQPPVLTVSTLSEGTFTNNATLNIAGTATDNTGVQGVTVNGTAVPVNADGSFSYALILKSGANKVTTIATDLAGNSSSDTRTITLDQTAPTLVVLTPADNSKTAAALASVTGTVDETSIVSVKLGGTVQTAMMNGNNFTATVNLVSGFNTIEITATDLAGNTSTQKRTVLYDNQTPSLAVTIPNQDIRTDLSSLTIMGTASDPLTNVSVGITMDGHTYTPAVVTGAFTQAVTFTTEKSYAIVVTATNEFGTKATVQRNVIYDITPPAFTINPVASPTNQNSQTVTGTTEAGATVTVTCATATVGAVSYPTSTTWSAAITNLTIGDNLLTAAATDVAGNVTMASAKITFQTSSSKFLYALFGNNGVTMSGGSYTDSYIGSPANRTKGQYIHGDVGSNSLQACAIQLSGGTQIFGKAWVGHGGSPAMDICATGGSSVLNNNTGSLLNSYDMTPKIDPGGGTAMGALNLSGHATKTLTAGNYHYTSITLSGGSSLTLSGPITLHVDGNLTVSGGSSIVVSSGTTTTYVNGHTFDISGGSLINNTQDPTNLIIYGTTRLQTVNLSGGSNQHVLLYAPFAAITVSGGQNTYGSLIGKSVVLSGGSSVHFEESLLQ